MSSEHIKRDVNSLLGFTTDFHIDDEDDNRDNGNRDRRNNDRDRDRQHGQDNRPNNNNGGHPDNRDNNQRNNGNNNNHSSNDQRNNNGNNNQQNQWNNPVCKILNPNDKVYDRDAVLDLLTRKDGLVIMIKDLKSAHKDPSKQFKANYVQKLLRDIVFASALPEALEDIAGKKYDESDIIGRKELGYLMSEILIFLNGSFNDGRLVQSYGKEAVESMRRSYTDMLYRFNKKKVKKLTEEIKNMSKGNAKQICIITSGNNPQSSIYQLLKFLYRGGLDGEETMFSTSVKSLTKLFKVCYGKEAMPQVIKCIMLERPSDHSDSSAAAEVSINLDLVISEYLEDLDKNEIYDVLKDYCADRRRMEKNGPIPRRFGGRNTIHPDDYPKLTKALDDIERKDFSCVQYLRK